MGHIAFLEVKIIGWQQFILCLKLYVYSGEIKVNLGDREHSGDGERNLTTLLPHKCTLTGHVTYGN